MELNKVKTSVESFSDDFSEILVKHQVNNGYFVAYLDYKVLIGIFENKRFIAHKGETFEPKYLQKLRIFNEKEELFLFSRNGESFSGRLRTDYKGEEKDVIDARQTLYGTTVDDKLNDGFTRIYEERGTELILPFPNISVNDKKERIFIHTRNYIGYNDEHGQAGYEDCRFVRFTDKDNNALGGD